MGNTVSETMANHIGAALLLLATLGGAMASSVAYTLDLNEWIVDYERPTLPPRIAPYKIGPENKMQALLVNNSFPGPALTAHEGDTIEVTILNNLMKDDVMMAFDGLKLVKGPSGFIIPQGGVGVYTLSAPHSGTFWWHATIPLQTASGLYGSFVVQNATFQAPNEELLVVLADARAAPNVCYDGSGTWDAESCPMAAAQKATLNGQWGDDSKTYPKPVVQVKSGVCYTMRMLGVCMQPSGMFDFSIQDHHFSLPDGQRNLPSLTVVPNAHKGIEATFCANQPKGIISHDYAITYSLYNVSEPTQKQDFSGILRYV